LGDPDGMDEIDDVDVDVDDEFVPNERPSSCSSIEEEDDGVEVEETAKFR
jgi:hypothetical protein